MSEKDVQDGRGVRRRNGVEDDEEARARRLNILRAMAAGADPAESTRPDDATEDVTVSAPHNAARLAAPRRRDRRGLVIAGITLTAVAILVAGGLIALHPSANSEPGLKQATPNAARILSPKLASATVYIASNNGDFSHLFAVNAASGQIEWRFAFGASYTTPIVSGSTLYTASSDGYVYAINAKTGRQIWAFQRSDQRDAYLILDGSVLYANDEKGYVYAIDAASGKQIWRFKGSAQDQFKSMPALANGLLYAASGIYQTGNGMLYAFDIATGAIRWRAPIAFAAYGAPAFANGDVYVTGTDGTISAFAAKTGAKRWSAKISSSFNSGVTISGPTLYVMGQDGVIYAVNGATGALVWRVAESGSLGGFQNASPLVENGVIYVGSPTGALYALKVSDGSQIWQFSKSTQIVSSPVMLDGALFFGDNDGYLYALRASDGAQAWVASLDDTINASPAVAAA